MHWGGENDRLTEEQVALHKSQLRRLSDMQVRRSYEMYLRVLALEEGSMKFEPTLQAPRSAPDLPCIASGGRAPIEY